MSGVLAVFAHPDDESLLAGGTLAACASADLDVRIISMTRGELGGNADGPADLGAVREAELRAAGRVLGAKSAECLDYPDGELALIDEEEAVRVLARLIRWLQPQAVITFSAEGLYWHPDHVAVHRFATAALGDGDRPRLYGATWPKARLRVLVSEMEARGLPTELWGLDPEAFGVSDDTSLTVLDVRPFLERKLRALGCHQSQLPGNQLFRAIPEDLAADFLGREYLVPLSPERSACG
jgi:LmbE family N-acetylglucosaminyl deacetylase